MSDARPVIGINEHVNHVGLPVVDHAALRDRHARQIKYLRVSVTDRCNYRCAYCMPEKGWARVDRTEVLTLEETLKLVELMCELGVTRVRLTGGEPTVRRGLTGLVQRLSALPGLREVAMTTNGHLLEGAARGLHDAGLRGLNISLDTLDPARFAEVTRGGRLERVVAGLDAALAAGFVGVKLNVVAIRGVNDDELPELAAWAFARGVVPRFIELMPIGKLAYYTAEHALGTDEILAALRARFPLVPAARSVDGPPSGPAAYWTVADGRFAGHRLGVISPMTDDGFCGACNRARLTSRGALRACLGSDDEVSLRDALRAGASRDELVALVASAVTGKRPAHQMRSFEDAPSTVMTSLGG